MKPEILGRLTGSIVFRPISNSVLHQVISKELSLLQNHLLKDGRAISVQNNVIELLVQKMTKKLDYGARDVKSMVARERHDPLAEFILDNPAKMSFDVSAADKKIIIDLK